MPLAVALLWMVQTAATLPWAPLPSPFAVQSRLLALPDGAVAYIPSNARSPAPLLILLHGGDRRPLWMIEQLKTQADARGIALLAPISRSDTWDVIGAARTPRQSSFGFDRPTYYLFTKTRDSARVDAAIAALEAKVPIEPERIVLAGFSDGASFALALGMARAEPFSAVIAWSPGIPIETSRPARRRRVLISHARQDRVLGFDVDCGQIVPLLRSEGAVVTFLPFDGAHEIPALAKTAFLDAAFGPAPGTLAQPLPTALPVCRLAP